MRAFVTGGTGFAGFHLISELLEHGAEIFALEHAATSHAALPSHPNVHPLPGNLLDSSELTKLVAEARPDVIFHLAGQASPPRSWEIPAMTFTINTVGTINLLEAARAFGQPRVIIVTSADIYGHIQPDKLPLDETTIPRPRHPYGVSKLAASQLVPLYWERYRLPVIEARPFNHIGPQQMKGFVVPDFASQLAAIKLGQVEPTISVGNLDAERDFTDVRDVVAAYRLIAEKGVPGEAYLICSGQPVSIHYLLQILVEHVGMNVNIDYDPARMRPSETPSIYGNAAKLRRDTGWEQRYHLRDSLQDALHEWIAKLDDTA